jgi:hypothetical protein
MSRNRVDLDRIAVASPCPMNWNDMIGDDRMRFCNQCNLNVYNISAMTKAEAESFIGDYLTGVVALDSPQQLPTNDTIPSGELRRKDRPRE